jgi:hypothetical protein
MIVLLATLSVADSPTAIVEWGYHHPGELETVLRIKPKRMPERNTCWRFLAYKVYETEITNGGGVQSKRRAPTFALWMAKPYRAYRNMP